MNTVLKKKSDNKFNLGELDGRKFADKRELNKALKEYGLFSKFMLCLGTAICQNTNPKCYLDYYYDSALNFIGECYTRSEWLRDINKWSWHGEKFLII